MSLLDSEPRAASVVARKDATLLRIDRDNFYDLLYERKEIAGNVIALLVRRLREANLRK
mgnify:CR=1 FL=1